MREALRRELTRWGFSETEIDVYLATVEIGDGRTSTIADRADVSTRHVYRVATRLEQRGLVDLDTHVTPTRVRARPPEVIDAVVEQSRETLVEGIESLYAGPPDRPANVEVLKRQPTVFERARDMLASADDWALVVAPADSVARVADELAAAVDRGIFVQFLTDEEAVSGERTLADLGTIVRTYPNLEGFQPFGIVVDTYRSLMVSPSAGEGDDQRYTPALDLTDEILTPRLLASFEGNEWRLGEERVTPAPAPLPFESEVYQRVIVQAAIHDRAGTPLLATVEGRRVADGEPATVTGDLVAVRQGFVEPYGKTFLFEEALELETADGRVTVGDPAATVEDYAADRVTLDER